MEQLIYQCDDGHGDYNRSYESHFEMLEAPVAMRYADYSTDHRENNFRNYENKVPKSKKERVRNILNHYE